MKTTTPFTFIESGMFPGHDTQEVREVFRLFNDLGSRIWKLSLGCHRQDAGQFSPYAQDALDTFAPLLALANEVEPKIKALRKAFEESHGLGRRITSESEVLCLLPAGFRILSTNHEPSYHRAAWRVAYHPRNFPGLAALAGKDDHDVFRATNEVAPPSAARCEAEAISNSLRSLREAGYAAHARVAKVTKSNVIVSVTLASGSRVG